MGRSWLAVRRNARLDLIPAKDSDEAVVPANAILTEAGSPLLRETGGVAQDALLLE